MAFNMANTLNEGPDLTYGLRELLSAKNNFVPARIPWFIGDGFPKSMGVDEIAGLLSSVGFSSPATGCENFLASLNAGWRTTAPGMSVADASTLFGSMSD